MPLAWTDRCAVQRCIPCGEIHKSRNLWFPNWMKLLEGLGIQITIKMDAFVFMLHINLIDCFFIYI